MTPRPPALPADVDFSIRRYLRATDTALPGFISAFYVVGSTALGAYRRNRSDIDFVAIGGNLSGYWEPWADSTERSPVGLRLRPRYWTA